MLKSHWEEITFIEITKNPYFLVHDDQACVRLVLFSPCKEDPGPRSDPKDPIPKRAGDGINILDKVYL